ncbi:unnamed protein product [Amaranthus hypochondriacus]
MPFLRSSILIILFFALLNQIVESRLTQEILNSAFPTSTKSHHAHEGTKWAVLIAGSQGFGNYRHQADICHAYQILKRGGLKDENIIVFMYDDIAYNDENPRKGIIINHPHGKDVYKGVPKDYTGKSVTSNNFLAAILGNKTAIKGGSGKVVNSGPNDRIFIYYSDHGSPGMLTMPHDDDELYAKDFIHTLKKKHQMGTYKSMVIYVEACEAGSMFAGLMQKQWNIYVTTASNPNESSWATYCPDSQKTLPSEFDTCLGDLYSVAWMEDCDAHNSQSETLKQQYQVVKRRTLEGGDEGSHVMEYGNTEFSNDTLSLYFGSASPASAYKQHKGGSHHKQPPSPPLISVKQLQADILYLTNKVLRAPKGSIKRKEAQEELDAALSHREKIDRSFEEIGKSLFGDENGNNIIMDVRPMGQPLVDDWDCFKTMADTYKIHCGQLSTYGKRYMRAFANMCNAGIQPLELAKVASQLCGK